MVRKISAEEFKKRLETVRTCKCGHRVLVPNRYDFVYCDYCFRRVYRDDRTEFKFKLMEELGEYSNEQIPKQKGRNRRN